MVVDFIIPLPLEGTFSYRIPESMTREFAIGKRALVPFGPKKILTAIAFCEHQGEPPEELKSIVCFLDDSPIVLKEQLCLWQWVSDYYMCTPGEVMKAALPASLKLESETKVQISDDFIADVPLKNTEAQLYDILSDGKVHDVAELSRRLQSSVLVMTIGKLLQKGAVRVEESVEDNYKPKVEKQVVLAQTDNLNAVLDSLSRAKTQQAALLEYLHLTHSEALPVPQSCLPAPAVKALVEKGIFKELHVRVDRVGYEQPSDHHTLHQLSAAQQKALDETESFLQQKKTVLLYGVTGSGKTDIYIRLILEQLNANKQVLYLVPEIALTTQLTDRLRVVFGERLLVYHSRFSDAERYEIYLKLLEAKQPYLVLGVRSSVFLPFADLGLVIVDEEHEPSYKQQDPAPRYHARSAALVLASFFDSAALLGSATPALESYQNALNGKYALVRLTERYGGLKLPEQVVIDLREQYRRKEITGHVSDPLLREMKRTVEDDNKQLIIFQNRRGYAHYVECKECGYVPRCINCDVALSYHKFTNSLICHYCGYVRPMLVRCDACESETIADRGLGTERIEDELSQLMPKARVRRMDTDTTRRKRSYQQIIDDFASHRFDILVGTQMVSKGLDFDNVQLVAVVQADSLFNQPDFRCQERAFQLLEQVSGRAGRKYEGGKVVVQTYSPDNAVLSYVARHDYEGFANVQLKERQMFHYPPFYRLVYINVEHVDCQSAIRAASFLQEQLKRVFTHRCSNVLEPSLSKVKNRYRRQILLKFAVSEPVGKAKRMIAQIMQSCKKELPMKGAILIVDVDPM